MSWELQLVGRLKGVKAPRVLSFQDWHDLAKEARPGVHENTVRPALDHAIAAGVIKKVHRGLYLNQLAVPNVSLAEAARHVRAGAVVSLQMVLGEFGVSNNPSSAVTCVLPYGEKAGKPSTGRVQTEAGLFIFHALPERFFPPEAGKDLLLDRKYQIFTPEKALLDWLYLGDSSRSTMTKPPPDLDLDNLQVEQLRDLAQRLELTDILDDYLEHQQAMGHGVEGAVVRPARRRP